MPTNENAPPKGRETKSQWMRRLLREFEGRLLRYAARFVKLEVARELVQETYARLWKEEPETLRNREREWLFHVCRNLALDYLKKEKPLSYISQENAILPEAENALEKEEDKSEVQHLLRALPAPQQEVLRLKFQESMSYKEIAQVTGHSVSHVGVLIHEAMKAMRSQMHRKQALKGGVQ